MITTDVPKHGPVSPGVRITPGESSGLEELRTHEQATFLCLFSSRNVHCAPTERLIQDSCSLRPQSWAGQSILQGCVVSALRGACYWRGPGMGG